MAVILKIFIALIVTASIVKDGARSCTLRSSHKTGSPPPCPTDPDSDANSIPGRYLPASAPCASPALGPRHQLSDAPTNAITSNSPGSNSIPLDHRNAAVALPLPFPEPPVTPVPSPSSLEFDRFLVNLQRHYLSSGPTPVVTSPPVPPGPAKFAHSDRTTQIERLLTLLLSTPGIAAVPSPAAAAVPIAVPVTAPVDLQPQTAAVSTLPALSVDSAPIDTAVSGPEFSPIVVAPEVPNIAPDAVVAPSSPPPPSTPPPSPSTPPPSPSTPLQIALSPSTPPPPPPPPPPPSQSPSTSAAPLNT